MKRLLVLQHLEIEGPGLFEQFAKERDLKIEIIRLDNKNALPQTKKGDLILIMGGPMGVKDIGSDRYPWLKLERDFIKKELENERPIIGVCLGAQLLARAAGGDVEILKYGSPPKALPEIGWSQIFLNKSNKESIIFASAAATLKCMQSGGIYSIPTISLVNKFSKKIKISKIK